VPGGKVEEEESPTEAAVREASEEIGVEVELEEPFYTGEFQKDGNLYIWHAYLASADEDPKIMEDVFDDMKWFTAEELDEAELAPSIEMIEPALRKVLK
jgi:8-oxo-dGTP diphosphatase